MNYVSGTTKIWRNEREGRNGKFFTYSISIGKKVDDKYINKSVKVLLAKDIESSQTIPNGATINYEGFPTLDYYKDKDGKEHKDIAFFIQKLEVHDFAEIDEVIPF